MHFTQNEAEVTWPHVFASIQSETSHTHVNQSVEPITELLAHIFLAVFTVPQSTQHTVSHLISILVVFYFTTSCVTLIRSIKVIITIWYSRVTSVITTPLA